MSKWTEVRDSVVDALNLDDVTEQVKVDLTQQIVTNGMPAIEDVADAFVAKIQAQATAETGWNKVRDQVVLPLVMEGLVFVVKTVLTKATAENAKEEPAKGV